MGLKNKVVKFVGNGGIIVVVVGVGVVVGIVS